MPTDQARVPTPIAADEVRWEGFGEVPNYGSRWRHLTRAAWGTEYRIGVVIEEIPPGGKSAPFHYHFLEEEHVYVLEGSHSPRLTPPIIRRRPEATTPAAALPPPWPGGGACADPRGRGDAAPRRGTPCAPPRRLRRLSRRTGDRPLLPEQRNGTLRLPDDREPRSERRLRLSRLRQARRLGPDRGAATSST